MTRARVGFAAAFVASALFASITPAGQDAQAPDLQPVLAGKKFMPPVKGEAVIEYTNFKTARKGDTVVTSVTVRNLSPRPIARLHGQRSLVPEGRRRAHGRKSRDQRPAATAGNSDDDDHDAVESGHGSLSRGGSRTPTAT